MKSKPLGHTHQPDHWRSAAGPTSVLLAVLALAANLAASLNAQAPPEIAIEKSVLLSWPEDPVEEQIVLRANSLDGPWVPCLEPIFKRQGSLSTAVPTTGRQQYFKLAPGTQLSDDFSDPAKPWTQCLQDARNFETSYVNGALRIKAPAAGGVNRHVLIPFPLPAPPAVVQADFAMSVDILDWDVNAPHMEFGLCARATPIADCASVGGYCYFGQLEFHRGGPARLWVYGNPPNGPISAVKSIALDSQKAYRLVFSGVGKQLTLRLFDRDRLGSPLLEVNATNSTLSQGIFGLWAMGVDSAYDITVDNFIVTGTKP